MANSSNNKSMLSLSKNKHHYAVIVLVLILLGIVIALYYMRKNTNTFENFDAVNNDDVQREMSNTLVNNTSMKPNLKPASGECVVALFYADWCPHCVSFKPHFKKAMSALNGKTSKDGKKLRLEMVDCDADKTISRKYDVNGFPTVKLINDNGVNVEYDGERSYDGLSKYLVSDN